MSTSKVIKSTEQIVPLEKIGGDLAKITEEIPIKAEHLTEKMNSSSEKINEFTEKIAGTTEKRYRGCRGPDKKPRKRNENSIRNLKQYQIASKTVQIEHKHTDYNATTIFTIILFLLEIAILLWLYSKSKQNSRKLDSDSDVLERRDG